MFLHSVSLKIQLAPKWTKSDISKENCSITQAQCVICDYVSRKSISDPGREN